MAAKAASALSTVINRSRQSFEFSRKREGAKPERYLIRGRAVGSDDDMPVDDMVPAWVLGTEMFKAHKGVELRVIGA